MLESLDVVTQRARPLMHWLASSGKKVMSWRLRTFDLYEICPDNLTNKRVFQAFVTNWEVCLVQNNLVSATVMASALGALSAMALPALASTVPEKAENRFASVMQGKALEEVGDRSYFVTAYRRLTETQYRHAISDVFGKDVTVSGRFEPEKREDGLQAVGNAHLSITTSGLEQYVSLARSVSKQVSASDRLEQVTGCKLSEKASQARSCSEKLVVRVGTQLNRRPVTGAEVKMAMAIWDAAMSLNNDKSYALEQTLSSLLVSPEFLFRKEVAVRIGDTDAFELDAYTRASRLSFLLWDTGPDETLMAAAAKGDLSTEAGIAAQVERMISSERFEDGVRAFFTDMLYFEAFETLTKDPATYPKFSQDVADSAREETLRFLVEHLVRQDGDYREIFTSNETILNRSLAAVYNVPYPSKQPWTSFEFPEGSERSGLLTQVSFAALFSHPGGSSPTLRGKHLQEIFNCLPIPDPPADVDFSKVQAMGNGTVRERLTAHRSDPNCASCHVLMDPAGLALENFDSLGQFRTKENGDLIDVSTEIDGAGYTGAKGVGKYLHDNPGTAACVVQKAHYYGVGRPLDYTEYSYLQKQQTAFVEDGYRISSLFRNILTDPEFYDVVLPDGLKRSAQQAAVPEADMSTNGGN